MKSKYEKEKERFNKRRRKIDATEASLPHNRWQVFWDCLKVRWDVFLKIGGILVLAGLPLLVTMFMSTTYMISLIKAFGEGSITAEQYQGSGFLYTMLFVGIEAVCLLIVGIALAGISRVVKRLVFYESIQFKDDFFLGIKENIKPYIILTLIISIIYFISMVMLRLAPFSSNLNLTAKIVFYLPFALAVIIFVPAFLLGFAQVPIYKNKISTYIGNGFKLYLRSPFITAGIAVVALWPIYVLLIRNIYITLILGFLTFFIVMPLEIVGFHIYACWQFDLAINKEYYPQIVDKGIYRKDKLIKKIKDINDINNREDI